MIFLIKIKNNIFYIIIIFIKKKNNNRMFLIKYFAEKNKNFYLQIKNNSNIKQYH